MSKDNVYEIIILKPFEHWYKTPKRSKVAFGGRGGGKSESIARMLVAASFEIKGVILCARETQKSLEDSIKKVLEEIIIDEHLEQYFRFTRTEIENKLTNCRFLFRGLRDSSVESIKSIKGVKICFVEEAQFLSEHSFKILKPSIREEGSPEAMATEQKQGVTLDDVASKLDMLISQLAKEDEGKEETDINEELSKKEIVADEDETIEEEEEKKMIVDAAYNLAAKFKEEGVKYVKPREFDTKMSYLGRFLQQNKSLVADKYKHLLEAAKSKINKGNFAIAVDAMKSIEDTLNIKEKKKLEQANQGPVLVSDDGKTKIFKNVF